MPRSIQLVVQDGETLESALRRFKRQQPDSAVQEINQHPDFAKSGVKRKRASKTPLLNMAMRQVNELSPERQNEIAGTILADLQQQPDAKTMRFQELVAAKYTRGLTTSETSEMAALEAAFQVDDEAFYGPILERLESRRPS